MTWPLACDANPIMMHDGKRQVLCSDCDGRHRMRTIHVAMHVTSGQTAATLTALLPSTFS